MSRSSTVSAPAPSIQRRPPPAATLGSSREVSKQNLVPETWATLPEGPERTAAWWHWVADELFARGEPDSARRIASNWCPGWQPPYAPPAPAMRTLPEQQPVPPQPRQDALDLENDAPWWERDN